MLKDKSDKEGTHWAAIWAKRPNQVYYFDSYGEKPNKTIHSYLVNHFDKIIHNKQKFQSIFSNVCGHYTLSFIYFMSIGFEFEAVLRMFKNSNSPDHFVREFVISMFNLN